MTIEPGQTLLHYRIVEKIGEGGMGLVWKAIDTTLDREVAIKVLPDHLSTEPERLARFEREAKTLAALNHPNIATIHGLHVEDDRVFLAMELAAGEDLSQRLTRGALPVDEALDVARQVARALDAAHGQGIVHRDLKPANVLRASDGTVKVLDFGLAKTLGPEPGEGGDPAASPTITSLGTQTGMILGTAAYMSPEQARAEAVDRRTDLWALGVLLYEMLTGKQLFEGRTVSDVLAAVLRAEPDWDALPAATPIGVRRLLRRCLTRDPERRLRDMGDAALEINEALEGGEAEQESTGTAVDGAPPSRRFGGLLLAATALAAVLGTLLVTFALRGDAEPPPVRRLAISRIGFHSVSAVAISPDGRRIAYAVAQEVGFAPVRVRDLDSYTDTVISGPDGGRNPFFSPDSRWLAFAVDGGLSRVALDGGVPEKFIAASTYDVTGAWAPGDIVILSRARLDGRTHNGLMAFPAGEGEPRVLTTPTREERLHSRPHALPDGRGVLFALSRSTDLALGYVSLEGGPHRILLQDASTARYVEETGHLLFYRPSTRSVLAVGFDPERVEVAGNPVEVLRGVLRDTEGGGSFAVAGDGTLIYTAADEEDPMRGRYHVSWVDRDGKIERVLDEQGSWAQPRVSPDGRTLLLRLTATPNCDLWTYDLERRALTRVTFVGDNHDPIWHPSGRTITFAMEDLERPKIVSRSADGTGDNTVLSEGEFPRQPWSWSADGRLLAFTENHDDTGSDIWVLDTADGKEQPFLDTSFEEEMPALSPDGRWLAYASNESGRQEVYIRPYPGPGGRVQISNDGGKDPVWNRDGDDLFYVQGLQMMGVEIGTANGLRAGTPRKILGGPFIWRRSGNHDVSRDGSRFVMIEGESEMTGTELRVVLNWFEELRRLAPLDN